MRETWLPTVAFKAKEGHLIRLRRKIQTPEPLNPEPLNPCKRICLHEI
jgi:hypothetical protein